MSPPPASSLPPASKLERRETRLRLEAGARAVWGNEFGKENAPPKVFGLVGKTAEEVSVIASEVSQVTTGTEERVALNKMERIALR